MQDIGRGTHKYVAARYTFRRLFLAGLTALLTNVVGFAVLIVIDIPVIQDLALTTSIGVCMLIFTNLLLVPVLLSYIGRQPAGRAAQPGEGARRRRTAKGLGKAVGPARRFTDRRWAIGASPARRCSARLGFAVSLKLQDRRPRSGRARAARSTRATTATTPTSPPLRLVERSVRDHGEDAARRLPQGRRRCSRADRLAWTLRHDPRRAGRGRRCRSVVRRYTAGGFEGSPKWITLPRSQTLVNIRRAAGDDEQPRAQQPALRDHAGDRLSERPQGRDARAACSASPKTSPQKHDTQGSASSCRPPAPPASRRRRTSSSGMPTRRC